MRMNQVIVIRLNFDLIRSYVATCESKTYNWQLDFLEQRTV